MRFLGDFSRVVIPNVGIERGNQHQTFFHQLVDALLRLLATVRPLDPQRFADDVAHGHARVERGVRILEHRLDRLAIVPAPGAVEVSSAFAS